MNLEQRARDAAAGLRTATPVDAEHGLARLHRTRQRRTTGKVFAAVVVLAVAVGVVQIQRGADRAVPPVSPPGDWVLVTGDASGSDWSEPLSAQPFQVYPSWADVDPAMHRFLVGDEDGTVWNVMTPGRNEPLLTIPCPSGACFGAALGPGSDDVTIQTMPYARRPDSPDFRLEVIGPDGRSRGELGPSSLGALAWSPDGSTLSEVVTDQRADQASFTIVLRYPDTTDTTTLYDVSEPAPPWFDAEEHRFADWANAINGWGTPDVIDLRWAPDSSRLAFVTATTPAAEDRDRHVQWQLFVADTVSGDVQQIADLGRCTEPVADNNRPAQVCDEQEPSLAWGPEGEDLTVLADSALTTYDLGGKVLKTEPSSIKGPIVWIKADQ